MLSTYINVAIAFNFCLCVHEVGRFFNLDIGLVSVSLEFTLLLPLHFMLQLLGDQY